MGKGLTQRDGEAMGFKEVQLSPEKRTFPGHLHYFLPSLRLHFT